MSNCKRCGKPMRFVTTWGRAPLYLVDWMCDECGLSDTLPQSADTSDDGEPITREWFESEYGPGDYWITRLVKLSVTAVHGRVHTITNCDNCNGEVYRWLEGVKTRGQLRALLAALGWRGEEKHGNAT